MLVDRVLLLYYCAVKSFVDLQFPNGQVTYVFGVGLSTSAFLPVCGGLLQAQGQYPGEMRFSFSCKCADMLKAFLQEKKWSLNKQTPTFKEYLDNGWMSVSGVVILVHTYFLMSQNITKEGLESLENYHNLLRWPSIIFRLCNDLGTATAELERGETASSILCIMRETGLSEASARQHIKNLVEKTWKKLNKEILSAGDAFPFSKPFVETTMNLARIAQCTYQHGDGHGAPDSRSKNRVLSLIIDPIK